MRLKHFAHPSIVIAVFLLLSTNLEKCLSSVSSQRSEKKCPPSWPSLLRSEEHLLCIKKASHTIGNLVLFANGSLCKQTPWSWLHTLRKHVFSCTQCLPCFQLTFPDCLTTTLIQLGFLCLWLQSDILTHSPALSWLQQNLSYPQISNPYSTLLLEKNLCSLKVS